MPWWGRLGDQAMAVSPAGVVYASGEATQSADDLGLGATRLYGSQFGNSTGGLGWGWMLADQPYVVCSGNQYTVVCGPEEAYHFTAGSGSTFSGLYGIQETLAAESGNMLAFTRPDGTVYLFNGFGPDPTSAMNGQLAGIYQPDGSSQVVTGTAGPNGQISEMQWFAGGATTPYQTQQIAYYTAGVNAGRVLSITLLGSDGSFQRQVTYTYYDTNTGNGDIGCLESATTAAYDAATAAWNVTGIDYYRYTGDHLSLALTPQGAANAIAAAQLTAADPLNALRGMDSGWLGQYAAATFQYNTIRQVRAASVATVGGLRQYSYTYGADMNFGFNSTSLQDTDWYGQWYTSTCETRPDGTTLMVFSNAVGETMLTDLASAPGAGTVQHWVNYSSFGAYNTPYAGMIIETVQPSAVNMTVVSAAGEPGYDSSQSDLGVQLYATQGLITDYTFATSTSSNLSDTTAGNVAGYLQSTSIQNGTSGTPVPQEAYTYYVAHGRRSIAPLSPGRGPG